MARSRWKVPFISVVFFSKYFQKTAYFNTRIRSSTITRLFLDKVLRVYNGSKFKSFIIKGAMVDKKLGDFSITKVLGQDIAVSKALKAKQKKKKK